MLKTYQKPLFTLKNDIFNVKIIKMRAIKLHLLSFGLVLIMPLKETIAQKVFATNYSYQSEIKVFVVNQEYQADLKVFKVRNDYEATGQNGKWFFTKYDYQAKKKIYFVDHEYQSDLKIFFVAQAYQAGWKNAAKKHLLY